MRQKLAAWVPSNRDDRLAAITEAAKRIVATIAGIMRGSRAVVAFIRAQLGETVAVCQCRPGAAPPRIRSARGPLDRVGRPALVSRPDESPLDNRAGLLATGLALAAEPQVVNGLLAIVDQEVITYKDMMQYIAPAVETLMRTYGNQPEVLRQAAGRPARGTRTAHRTQADSARIRPRRIQSSGDHH
jgi:hypothetical protein